MNTDFIEMVAEMRQAQKEYFEIAVDLDNPSRPHLMRIKLSNAKAWELKVDRWIEQHKKEREQLALWVGGEPRRVDGFTSNHRADETPAAYNVTDEEAKAKGGAA